MRRVLPITLIAGCGFSVPGVGESGDDEMLPPDHRLLVDDTAADFSDPSERADVVLEPRGTIELTAYAPDTLLLEGFASPHLQQMDVVSWSQLEALLAADQRRGAALTGNVDVDIGNTAPRGVGLGGIGDNFTAVYRGEIFLSAGTTTFELGSDGPSLLEIATDGTFGNRMFARTSAPALTPRLDVTVAADGWYPIHAALTDTTGGAYIRFRRVIGGNPTPIPPSAFRAPITDARGLILQAFDEPLLVVPGGESLQTAALAADFMNGVPANDFDLTGDSFGLRMFGQLAIDVEGGYTFGATVDDRWRMSIDGTVVGSVRWPDRADSSTQTMLAPGWHDVVIDYADSGGPAAYTFTIKDAPPGVTTGTIPVTMLRPVARSGRTATASLPGTANIPQGTEGSFTFPPLVPAIPVGSKIDAVDVSYELSHTAPAEVTTTLLRANDVDILRTGDPTASPIDYFGRRTVFAGADATTGWRLAASDNTQNAATGTYARPTLTVIYRPPNGPISRTAMFASKARPTPGAIRIVDVRVEPPLPAGATVTAEVRACADPDTCTGTWAAPPIGGDDFVEYRLSIGTDSYAMPLIDRVKIEYAIDP